MRALWTDANGLSKPPTGQLDLMQIIHALGFVQLDTIQVISRAHHHILWSRNQNYREPMLDKLLRNREIFEHFTHDASVLPMEFLPMWQRQFRRHKEKIDRSGWYKNMLDEAGRQAIIERITDEGALSTHAFDTKVQGKKEMWARPPHKLALDYMWYSGELATCHRVNFTKFYDLGTRVFPKRLLSENLSDEEQIDRLCDAALQRLGCASVGEIQKFWDAVDQKEVREWLARREDQVSPVEIIGADGAGNQAYAFYDIEEQLNSLQRPTSRLRILNPFDPMIRDRNRIERLFGFEYRIEMFVPAKKRKWGYYVYPILEGDKFVGRIEIKADRQKSDLNVLQFWPEPKVKWTAKRYEKLRQEIGRMARFINVENINYQVEIA
ncbi:crosslink repair DNA glycosylase YcaQ family protein [Lentilitoribacter sp. Alg239-R112]|uniref:winged helix-turn-helix domain-containing protein n=1 Tax=Lentilitoribacter sp. Alg239-R112 TaxID=2305987 RepID=UPI0013A6990A|nr:crosslink repair DNA glycosylase YcaQ family protein [Lentilitoribacter sp. Alg239-R112]